MADRLVANIPHTLVFVNHALAEWYFVSRSGAVLRKNADKLTLAHALEALLAVHATANGPSGLAPPPTSSMALRSGSVTTSTASKQRLRSEVGDLPVVATLLIPSHSDPTHVTVRHFNVPQLRTYLRDDRPESKPRIGILQAFVRPYGIHNAVSRVTFTQNDAVVDVRVNTARFRDSLVPVADRLAAFVGPSYMSQVDPSHLSCSPALIAATRAEAIRIARHMEASSAQGYIIRKMCLYFKISHTGEVWFLYGGNVTVERTAPPPARRLRGTAKPGLPASIGGASLARKRQLVNRRKMAIRAEAKQRAASKYRSASKSILDSARTPLSRVNSGIIKLSPSLLTPSASDANLLREPVAVIEASLDSPARRAKSARRSPSLQAVNNLIRKRKSSLHVQLREKSVASSKLHLLASQASHESRINDFLDKGGRRRRSAKPASNATKAKRLALADLTGSDSPKATPGGSNTHDVLGALPMRRKSERGVLARSQSTGGHELHLGDAEAHAEAREREELDKEAGLLREIIVQLMRDVKTAQQERYRVEQEVIAKTVMLQKRKATRQRLEHELDAATLVRGRAATPRAGIGGDNSLPRVESTVMFVPRAGVGTHQVYW
ncbi:uncharacterized protein AMSG_12253 [Thecamonas trahens ATCC 50062]|uniref:Uncharacterized protein n=1 Tax=Thecamonas trahens ATCC 50062 TaxID=461836 RepID=A0A0L0DLA2_THETB|nr:hypothetical protein AMSG_12253 [Thecamonas trahens ATCC 50062]KNC53067.1 hypothetical protein AMSG_12253 [Thecamonas trahens ATCC 50062]|eukprot:XP_013754801.1 hypothetical protein AMSG_12253 [Thecamonas trahens ATCC 50062]